jgi:hypothetical protein
LLDDAEGLSYGISLVFVFTIALCFKQLEHIFFKAYRLMQFKIRLQNEGKRLIWGDLCQ